MKKENSIRQLAGSIPMPCKHYVPGISGLKKTTLVLAIALSFAACKKAQLEASAEEPAAGVGWDHCSVATTRSAAPSPALA